MPGETVPSTFVPRVLAYAMARGVDVRALIQRFELPRDAAAMPAVPITLPVFRAFGAAASELLREPFLGLRVALCAHNRVGGTVEAVLENCPDVATNFRQLERLQPLFSPLTRMAVVRAEGQIGIEYSVPTDPAGTGRENCEWAVVRFVESIRSATRVHVIPTRVWFSHEPRASITPLVDYFGTANIHFGQPHDGYFVDAEVGALPHVNANASVYATVDKLAEAELAARDPNVTLLPLLRARVRADLEKGSPNLEAIARHFGTSDRTLQRRIRELGTSFAAIVDDERRELAIQWVTDEKMNLDSLPEALGYGQKEAFWRAFKRWTGTTPIRFRRGERP